MRVVATRNPDELDAYAAALGPRVELIALPLVHERPPTPDEVVALLEAIATPGLTGLWLASARAVAPAVAALLTAGIAPPRAFTVGARTAAAARAAGLTAESLGDDGASAAHALAARGLGGATLLAPRAAGGRDDALAILTAAGATVLPVVAYRLEPRPADDPALAPGLAALAGAAACLVFAPSQVQALAALVDLRRLPPLVAIGPTTAAALIERGVATAAVAATPDPAGMAAALASVYPDGHELP
ncbi:MAG: uroporphyrinogen-III synthase [Myxococcales bacterium]|nr:uroporphyrinogen-III synthase [Myxococcales bacterium]